MTPKEFEFWYSLLERVSQDMYGMGFADATDKKPLKNEGFELSRASRLTIKTNLEKHAKKR